ncbi:hypothetical protein FI667_g3620, partial [Globisporangium splendens]
MHAAQMTRRSRRVCTRCREAKRCIPTACSWANSSATWRCDVALRRENEKELQVAFAKLSTEHTRVEAEYRIMRSKWVQGQEQCEKAQNIATQASFDSEIQKLHENVTQHEANERKSLIHCCPSNTKQCVLQAQIDAIRDENQQVVATREAALQALNVQSDELARARDANSLSQLQVKTLEKSVDRALQTRSRTLTWKKSEIDAITSSVFQRTLFLGWKSYTLRKRRECVLNLEARANAKQAHFVALEPQFRAKLVHTRGGLHQIRDAMAQHPRDIELFRDEIINVKLPQLLDQIHMHQEQCQMKVAENEERLARKLEEFLASAPLPGVTPRIVKPEIEAREAIASTALLLLSCTRTFLAVEESQAELRTFDANEESVPAAAKDVSCWSDADWKRWRRIDPAGPSKRKKAWATTVAQLSPRAASFSSSSLRYATAKSQSLYPHNLQGMTSPSRSSVHKPLFDSPSKYGVHHAIAAFTPTEQRFRWQNGSSSTDALYKLPTSIDTGSKKGFGTSTREDWDLTKKLINPCSGPGSYEPITSCGRQPSSLCRSSAVTAFDNASHTSLNGDTTPSPGPIYDLPETMRTAMSPKFGTSKRQPLNGKAEGPGPNIALKGAFKECRPSVSPTFGTER